MAAVVASVQCAATGCRVQHSRQALLRPQRPAHRLAASRSSRLACRAVAAPDRPAAAHNGAARSQMLSPPGKKCEQVSSPSIDGRGFGPWGARAPAPARTCLPPAPMRRRRSPRPPAPPPQVTIVYKFGGSSVATADRMREVADIVCSFPEHLPCVVLSAMGKVRAHHRQGYLSSGACLRPAGTCSCPACCYTHCCRCAARISKLPAPTPFPLPPLPRCAPRRPPTCCCRRARRRCAPRPPRSRSWRPCGEPCLACPLGCGVLRRLGAAWGCCSGAERRRRGIERRTSPLGYLGAAPRGAAPFPPPQGTSLHMPTFSARTDQP